MTHVLTAKELADILMRHPNAIVEYIGEEGKFFDLDTEGVVDLIDNPDMPIRDYLEMGSHIHFYIGDKEERVNLTYCVL